MTQEEFNLKLQENKVREAAIAASLMKDSDEEVLKLLYGYISCKYFLEDFELDTENLVELGEKSTAKMAGLQKSGLAFREKSAGCTTASSGVIKKILLAMAVGKCIGKKLDPDQVAATETVAQLADLVIKTRKSEA